MRHWHWWFGGLAASGCLGALYWTTCPTPQPVPPPATQAEQTSEEPFRPIPCPVTPAAAWIDNFHEPIEVLPEPHTLPTPALPETPATPVPASDDPVTPAPRPEPTAARMPYADEVECEFATVLRQVAAWRNEPPPRQLPSAGVEESAEPPLFDEARPAQLHCPYRGPCRSPR